MIQGFAQISSHVDAHPELRHRDRAKLTCSFGFVELSEIQQEPIYEDRGLCREIGKLWGNTMNDTWRGRTKLMARPAKASPTFES